MDQGVLATRLRDLRLDRELTQRAVAEAVGMPRSAVALIESGARRVSEPELQSFAALYGLDVKILMTMRSEDRSSEVDLWRVVGRTANELANLSSQKAIEQIVRLCQEGMRLRMRMGLRVALRPPDYRLPTPQSAMDAVRQAEHVAMQERRRLGLGVRRISEVADLIATQGIWASGVALPEEISGLYLVHDEIGELVLVRCDEGARRRRFSYAHEYAHALFDREQGTHISSASSRSRLTEVRANAFAAAFLMPRGGVEDQLATLDKGAGSREERAILDVFAEERRREVAKTRQRAASGWCHITYVDVALLAVHFGVNYDPMAYRLKNLGIISEKELRSLLDQYDVGTEYLSAIERPNDPGHSAAESKRLDFEITGVAIEAFRRGLLSTDDLLKLACLLPSFSANPRQLLSFAAQAKR